MRKHLPLLISLAVLGLGACRLLPSPADTLSPPPTPAIERHPAPFVYRRTVRSVPVYDPESRDPAQRILNGCYLTGLDLRGSLDLLLHADFDTRTVWPSADKMPEGFDRKRIMELGKNPGLGVRRLHGKGITGRGVGIAIVDTTLLTTHKEYADQLRLYEEIHISAEQRYANMHGTAAASIAVGKTAGVAPGADLYYIALYAVDNVVTGDLRDVDFRYYAQAVRRILQINEGLSEDRKIRVITMEIGWAPDSLGYDEIEDAVKEAKAAGVFVVSSSIEQVYAFRFQGLGRAPLADPDRFDSYDVGAWWAEQFYAGDRPTDTLLIPMDSRTTASQSGVDEYVFYREGGWSWVTPYVAGMYALAAQVDPDITPERFWALALETGQTIRIEHDGQEYPLGPILDPAALVDALRK